MARMHVRYFVEKGRGGAKRLYYWQPSKPLRVQGWEAVRLSDDRAKALLEAEQINTMHFTPERIAAGDAEGGCDSRRSGAGRRSCGGPGCGRCPRLGGAGAALGQLGRLEGR